MGTRWLALAALLLGGCSDPGKGPRDGPSSTSTPTTPSVVDADGDGYGEGVDCDDSSSAIHPGADELCDGLDNDCDDLVDDADQLADDQGSSWWPDADDDGYGDDASGSTLSCDAPTELGANPATQGGDCDDADGAIHPAATEICDPYDVDEDCDGLANDADPTVDPASQTRWYTDADADGHGDPNDSGILACDPPATGDWSLVADDCDETNPDIRPSAAEVCDPADVDEDCDGLADDADPDVDPATTTAWSPDTDGDGFGDASATVELACDAPAGGTWVTDATDCDDTAIGINPSAVEVCDPLDIDEDCDGLVDDADPSVDPATATEWYVDADLDGFGDAQAAATPACEDPSDPTTSYVDEATDCDDSNATVNPGGTEIYGDGVDQTCAGGTDYPTFSCSGRQVPGDYASIGAASTALGNSNSVQTICLSSRTYSESPTIAGNLRIIGPSARDAIINGHVTIRSSLNGASVDLQGVTVRNGVEIHDDGGAVLDITLSDCIIEVTNQRGVYIQRDNTGTPNTRIERCIVYGDSPDEAIYLYDYSYNETDRIRLDVLDSYVNGGQYAIRTAVTSSSTRRPLQQFTIKGNTITGASYGIYAAGRGNSSIFRIYNNIIADNSRGFSFTGSGNMSNDYNLYWGNSSTNFYLSATPGTSAITGADPQLSADVPPVPSDTGAAAGAGSSAQGSATDYWTNPRPSPPSVGAVEPF